ncbi:AAA family ATPase [Streptomyces sp. NBC_01317]|uniref:AAA family ATPase n=1 Tax=Streptomyces sp. NBC_01317 TaxID=2903822 RepID=UPI002E11EE3F|nr:AAA family ATPase [Streptomyces sp. NBC_01317]
MIVWLNGTFGAGKTTTAKELTGLLPQARVFDPEEVGYMLRHVLNSVPHTNFQEWTPWRGLVVETAAQVLGYVGGVLVVPQTVLTAAYWTEIRTGLAAKGIPVHHFVLHTDRDTLTTRIRTDTAPESLSAVRWRLDHLTPYEEALPWLRREATVLDTTHVPPAAVARTIADAVRANTARPTAV